MQLTVRHIAPLAFGVFLALTAGFCDSPTKSFGPRKPACWKPLVADSGSFVLSDGAPAWSNIGDKIAYYSNFDSCNNPGLGIYVTDRSGIPKDPIGIVGTHFEWLPGDTEMIVNTGAFIGGQLFKFNLNTKVATDMHLPTSSLQFDVSADGNLLYYVRDSDGWIVERNLATGAETQLVQFGGHPTISPDGNKLAYRLGTLNVFNLTTRKIDTLAPSGQSPVWAPDGAHLYYHQVLLNEIHKVDTLGKITLIPRGGGDDPIAGRN